MPIAPWLGLHEDDLQEEVSACGGIHSAAITNMHACIYAFRLALIPRPTRPHARPSLALHAQMHISDRVSGDESEGGDEEEAHAAQPMFGGGGECPHGRNEGKKEQTSRSFTRSRSCPSDRDVCSSDTRRL